MAVKRKRKLKLEDKEQSRRFVETARKLEADDDRNLFEKACTSVMPKRSHKNHKAKN